jgi:glycosyltransferase involved in cell wall biosynthesis
VTVGKKVIFCVPTLTKPHQATLDALASSLSLIQRAGWEEGMVSEVGCPYISSARATMLRKALDAKADVIVFIDHDVSWRPADLLKLIETEGDVVAGTYRFKRDDEVEYMGALITQADGTPLVRESDGAILAHSIPAGFLKVTKEAIGKFCRAYPDLLYGEPYAPHIDLFNHGAHQGVWYGEDYAFARRWRECGGQIWLVPDLTINHHAGSVVYPGNYHEFLLRQPGGSESPEMRAAA